MFDFINYRDRVLQTYKEKKEEKTLHPLLARPTPRKIRDACAEFVKERFNQRDKRVLKTFFVSCETEKDCLKSIREFKKISKFRPLLNFINGEVSDPEEENVELLAWLIDFQPRPFDDRRNYVGIETEEQEAEKPGNQEGDEVVGESQPVEKSGEYESEIKPVPATEGIIAGSTAGNSKKRPFIVGGIMLALICAVFYGLFVAPPPPPKGECMYWAEDHYQPISCTQKIEGKLIIALDTVKVKHFKKITDPKAIILAPKGSIWYSKINNEVEFFTSDGYHPIKTNYRLKPATLYIIDKYAHSKTTSP